MPFRKSEYFRSPRIVGITPDVVVTLPTFRRPEQVVVTLKSLEAQRTERSIAVIVMDNDDEGLAGAAAAQSFFENSPLPGMVVVAHERGNCHAYNSGWETTLETFASFKAVAVIDDDEIAAPEWIESLAATMEATGADIIGGPQHPIFDDPARGRWKNHPVFKPHYTETGPVPILFSSGNMMVARHVLDAMPQPFFDPKFNFVGGGDSDLLRRCKTAGFGFAWSAEGAVQETIPKRRTELSWLTARGLRNGAISALIENRQAPGLAGRLRTLAKSFALLAASPPRGVLLWVRSGSPFIGLYHAHIAVGRLMAEVGWVNEQYRNPEAN